MRENVKKMNLEYVNNSALKAMKALPKEIALQFATDLQRVQEGKSPLSDFKHLKGIGQSTAPSMKIRCSYCTHSPRPRTG